jgi:hypothetical protein
VFRNPNRNGNKEESTLMSVGWDRVNYRWRQPVQVDVIGQYPSENLMPVSLARDASTGRLGLVWLRNGNIRTIAFSNDNGNTWTKQTVAFIKGEREALSCALALANGKIHLVYFTDGGPIYITGNAADESSKWTRTSAPPQTGMHHRHIGHIAVDASGKPAIAHLEDLDSHGVAVLRTA